MTDDAKVSLDLLLKLHSGLEVLKSRQSEINRRLGLLEEAVEAQETSEEEAAKDSNKWVEWFLQGVVYVVAVTATVFVGRMFGLEVVW